MADRLKCQHKAQTSGFGGCLPLHSPTLRAGMHERNWAMGEICHVIRSFARTMVVLWLCLIASITGAADQRPNVVVLLSDDLGYKDVECYGAVIKLELPIDAELSGGLKLAGRKYEAVHQVGNQLPDFYKKSANGELFAKIGGTDLPDGYRW